MCRGVKTILKRDKLFSVLLIFSLTITVLMVLLLVSTNSAYDEKLDSFFESTEEFYPELNYDEYQNVLLAKKLNNWLLTIILFFALVNCIVVVHVWMVRKGFEFAVRKTYGSTNFMLWLRLLGELLCYVSIATVFALACLLLFVLLGYIEGGFSDWINDWLIVLFSELVICITILTLNFSYVYKLLPVQLLCRGKI